MEHFYNSIHGWTDEHIKFLYTKAVNENSDGAHFVEIGSWKGMSAAYMCVEIINSGKKIKFDCVDPWTGTSEAEHGFDQDYQNKTLFETFNNNLKSVQAYYNAVRMPSVDAAKLYEDESLDFVFIDGAHDYDNVKADILAWLPKVKSGKILCGHDWCWGGVRPAVEEILGRENEEIQLTNGQWPSWIYIKK